jgi:hypothetical protein
MTGIFKTGFGEQGLNLNNAIKDPLQGFDCDVWVVDQATGIQTLVGSFVSLQVIVRNSTEAYLEMNQTVTRTLDGVWQFGWVMERGMIDTRVLEQTWGVSNIQREMRLGRMPRFMVTFDLNAPELDESQSVFANKKPASEVIVGSPSKFATSRKSTGQYRMINCKVDSLTMDFRAGQTVVANRWEGLAEGITFIDQSNVWAGVTNTNVNALQGTNLVRDNLVAQGTVLGAPAWLTNNI